MKIVSLLPAATELLFALGLGDDLVGVTDECDYPAEASQRPVVIRSLLPAQLRGPREMGSEGSRPGADGDGKDMYALDEELLGTLQPDVILTQDSCRVCGVPSQRVKEALAELRIEAEIVSLDPHSMEEVPESFVAIGEALGRKQEAEALAGSLAERFAAVRAAALRLPSISVLAMEWAEPPWAAGRWVPEMVVAAGGVNLLSEAKAPSHPVAWKEVADAAPEVIAFMPRGYYLEEAEYEAPALFDNPDFAETPAARGGGVFAVDAASYFSRPGPRLADGLGILAWAVHPEAFPEPPPGTVTRVER